MGIMEKEKGTQKGNRGGATRGENPQVTRESRRHLNSALSPGPALKGRVR